MSGGAGLFNDGGKAISISDIPGLQDALDAPPSPISADPNTVYARTSVGYGPMDAVVMPMLGLIQAATQADARAALGLGSASLSASGAFATALQGAKADTAVQPGTTLAWYGITDAVPSSHAGAGGSAHAAATTSVAGFLSAADKTNLNVLTTLLGALVGQVNDTNARQNTIAANLNALATAFNTLLTKVTGLEGAANNLRTAGLT